jgi:pimeloyl-ACP methyl ester carboxylesterase
MRVRRDGSRIARRVARARWAGIAALLALGCLPRDFAVFAPVKTDRYTYPGNHVPLDLLEEHRLAAADGVPIAAITAVQPAPAACPTALYLHGQGTNLDVGWPDVQVLWDAGYNVVAVDYRGYGTSGGEPSEAGLYLDARAALALALGDARLDPDRLVIWGNSLGAAVASELALEAPAAALVMVAPFTSMTDMVELSSPYGIAADWMTDAALDNLSRVGALRLPTVVVHGTDDRRVPTWMGEEVYRAAAEPKRLVLVPGAGHGDVLERGLGGALAALAELAPEGAPAATPAAAPAATPGG